MPAVLETQVTLSAGQAAGTTPIVAANPNRLMLTMGNPGANNLLISVTNGHAAGEGMPVLAGGIIALGKDLLCPTQAIYGLGTAGDKITIWEC